MKNALILGSFDGIHLGHRSVIDSADGYNKAAVTFRSPPKTVGSEKGLQILSLEDKCNALKELGVEKISVLDFSEVRDTSAIEFLKYLKENFSPELIAVGFNYRFGKNAEGDTNLLAGFCRENGIECRIANAVLFDGKPVSSSYIRDLIKTGEISRAASLLYKPFSFEGTVTDGDKRGRTLGFPTANVVYPTELVCPKFGVYKVDVMIDGIGFEGISNIGYRPTFATEFVISETYIKNFNDNIYGKKIRIIPKEYIRSEKKFSSVEELKKQIEKDISL